VTKYDVENALEEIAAWRGKVGSDVILGETLKLGQLVADGFRREFDDELDMEATGKALVIAAGSLPPLVTGGTKVPGGVVMNLIAFAGENLIRAARARAAERGDVDGVLCEHVFTWHAVDMPDDYPGTEVPLYEHIEFGGLTGEFRSRSREVPPPAGDEPEWCPHRDCHDRVHGDGTHSDEFGNPFRGDLPEVSGA
jgi:hypothetical protein